MSNRQSPDSKSGDKHIWVRKTLKSCPREKETDRIAINLPRFLLGVSSVKIVHANGAKNPIRNDDTYFNQLFLNLYFLIIKSFIYNYSPKENQLI